MRTLGLLTAAAIALAACAGGEQNKPLMISQIQVETDLPAVGSREAVNYWKSLSADLETAIASEFAGYIDPTGNKIVVDIDEISLRSAFATGATAETARLTGQVQLLNPAGTQEAVYNVSASAQDIATYLPAGSNIVAVKPTSAEYYRAVVQAFARGTAQALRGAS